MDDFYFNTQNRIQALMDRQEAFLKTISQGNISWSKQYLLPQNQKNDLFFPCVEIKNLDFQLEELKKLPDFDYSVFAKWRMTDLPVMIVAGILGALTSRWLHGYFDSLHKTWGKLDTLKGGHAHEAIDWAQEYYDMPGGFGHRTLFGHDFFNPFEVDWSEYQAKATESNTIFPKWIKAGFYWLRHLFQDTFSAEGLPLPGHSLIRDFLNPQKNHELIKYFGTIKMRDLVGAGVTNLIMGGYLWGTEGSLARVTTKPNYRAFSLMLGANFVNLSTGLLTPPPLTTLNWSTIPVMGYYLVRLIIMECNISKELKIRDRVLDDNENTLMANMRKVAKNEEELNRMMDELLAYDQQVCKYYDITNDYQRKLGEKILYSKGE